MKDYPCGVLRVYDNEGITFDRYTVYYNERNERSGFYSLRGMSEHPTHPQGYGQCGEGMLGRHNGKQIAFGGLPADCRAVVLGDLNG